jgi:hypothetical protein
MGFATLLRHPRESRDPGCEPTFQYHFWNFSENLPDRKDSIVARSERCPTEIFFQITKEEEVTWCWTWAIMWMQHSLGFCGFNLF